MEHGLDPQVSCTNDDIIADLLVIGCGAAGATCALKAAKAGLSVVMITGAAELAESNSDHAQGGIVALSLIHISEPTRPY